MGVYASPRAQRISPFWCLLWYVGFICILGPLFVRTTLPPKLFVDNWISMLTVCIFECFVVSIILYFFFFLVLKVHHNFCVWIIVIAQHKILNVPVMNVDAPEDLNCIVEFAGIDLPKF